MYVKIQRAHDFVSDNFIQVVLAIGAISTFVALFDLKIGTSLTALGIGLLAWLKVIAQKRDRLIVAILALAMTMIAIGECLGL